ncbi:hypothetical protein [Actinomadura xylanilytica]|uniref:hypothetical protein n=1 Tax=Actinomadura xylanilytica TaxID=887459 RepID=UPI00255A8D37|nr:hypothetical protein [Actinomadura xylanilytica]
MTHEDQVTAGPGGVMTVEVGVVTGDLTVVTTVRDDKAHIAVQYTGADEWYTLQGSPVPLRGRTGADVHREVLERVRAGGEATAPD